MLSPGLGASCLLAMWKRTGDYESSFDVGMDANPSTGTLENIIMVFI